MYRSGTELANEKETTMERLMVLIVVGTLVVSCRRRASTVTGVFPPTRIRNNNIIEDERATNIF
jgi:hypothetical protein